MAMQAGAHPSLLVLNAAVLLCSQLLLKRGLAARPLTLRNAADLGTVIATIATSPVLAGGVILGALSTLLWVVVLSRHQLSYAAPLFNAIYYVMLVIASALVLHERIGVRTVIGTILIVAGIAVLSKP